MKTRKISSDPKKEKVSPLPSAPIEDHGEAPPPLAVRSRQHVYRVGGLRIPVKNPDLIQGLRSRFARKYKEILRKTARVKKPEEQFDPDVIEPPIHHGPRVLRRSLPPSREGRSFDPDRDVEDEKDDK